MPLPIHDLHIQPIDPAPVEGGELLPLLRYSDHLLRRFGAAELVRLPAGGERQQAPRPVADEVWALVRGTVQFEWEDRREGSPTSGARFELKCDRPTQVLVPFGVAFAVRALDGPAELVRLATHENDPPDG